MVVMNEHSTKGFTTSLERLSNPGNMKLNSEGKEDGWCSHFKKFGHTKKTCFILHGKDKVFLLLA